MFNRPSVWLIVLSLSATVRADEGFQKLSFEKACAAAQRDGKVVLIDFYTTWCGPCKMMDRTTWKDKMVVAWMKEKTVALKVDAEKQVELAEKYNITGYPTMIFIKPDGQEIDRLVGSRGAAGFLEDANAALAGKDGVVRAKEKLKGVENDPMKRMDYARSLEQRGKYDEALDEFLWCFDHGLEHSMGFTGVRLSFLLNDIHRLSAKLPRANEELIKRREAAEAHIFAKPGDRKGRSREVIGSIMEVSAINRTLGESRMTLALYDKLLEQGNIDPDVGRMLLREVTGLLLEAKRYDDLLKGVGGPKNAVEVAISQHNQIRAMTKSQGHGEIKEMEGIMKKRVVDEGAAIYEALVGTEQTKQANSVSMKLIDFDPSADTYITLMNRAVRAGNNGLARTLAAAAEKDLQDEDAERVAHAAKAIPGE